MVKDPICGMAVDKNKTSWKVEKDRKMYYFCSKRCMERFIKQQKENPPNKEKTEKVKKKTKAAEPGQDEGTTASMKEEKVSLQIEGMDCASCAANIERGLMKIKGVKTISVNFASTTAFISYDPAIIGISDIEKRITELGYDVYKKAGRPAEKTIDGTKSMTLHVIGMGSLHCANIVEGALKRLDGIKNIEVNFSLEKVILEYDPQKLTYKEIRNAIINAGYDAEQWLEE